ncbi:MAG TPA: DUF5946 family protein [Steroidobacteraceae bacterium]|jgi:hypothetical protein|nr:DUF5946 family protein [Steroidobacteraceae bacterium]
MVIETHCPGCGVLLPEVEGPSHRYMHSSPACWQAFGQILEREYSRPELFEVHRLCVDSYAVQHPGSTSRQAIQSVGLHLVRLCWFLERGLSATDANDALLNATKHKADMTWLKPPESLGDVNVKVVLAAEGVEQHKAAVRAWADSAWKAWSSHHDVIRRWADTA